MAATTASSITRARSLHISGRTHLPPPPPSLGNPAPPPPSPAPSGLLAPGASNVSLFLANLRLLDLDLLPDWPAITPQTFVYGSAMTTAGAQGQKRRVQCVEWALVRLFEIWDPEETRNKLLPLFPPVDQVQSVALRGALLKLLEQVKKNGVLGRDVLVRKTILDECRGDRLEEVLAVFSSAVLKSVIADQASARARHPPLAQALAFENRGYAGERTEIAVLALAHRCSLQRMVREKDQANARFRQFAQTLDNRERAIAHRVGQVRPADTPAARPSGAPDPVESASVWRAVKNSWTGDERWIEALRFGDAAAAPGDGLLGMPFDKVWRRVEQGRLEELEAEEANRAGLLEQLEGRVMAQNTRLERWSKFRQTVLDGRDCPPEPNPALSPQKKKPRKGIDLGFRAHESLLLTRLSPRKTPAAAAAEGSERLKGAYGELVCRLQDELATERLRAGLGSLDSLLYGRPAEGQTEDAELRPPRGVQDDPISASRELGEDRSTEDQERTPRPTREPLHPIERGGGTLQLARPVALKSLKENTRPAVPPKPAGLNVYSSSMSPPRGTVASPTDFSAAPSSPPSSPRQPVKPGSPTRSPTRRRAAGAESPTRPRPPPSTRPPVRRAATTMGTISAPPPPPPPIQALAVAHSPTQQLADQILASMNDASPSPAKAAWPKRQLSLADRTKLTMSRNASKYTPAALQDYDYDDEPLLVSERGGGGAGAGAGAGAGEDCWISTSDIPPSPCPIRAALPEEEKEDDGDDLIARTRRSMAGFKVAQQKARLERARAQKREREAKRAIGTGRPTKETYFDIVADEAAAEEAAAEEAAAEEGGQDGGEDGTAEVSIIAEELIEGGQEDYEAVFMSRPRLKASPAVSRTPSSEWA